MGSTAELAMATEMNARADGNNDAAKLVHKIFNDGPKNESVKKILDAIQFHEKQSAHKNFLDDEALALMLHLALGKQDYLYLGSSMVQKNIPNMYPSYPKIQEATTRSMPDLSFIEVTETHAAVNLQALLDHTAARLILMHESSLLEIAR